MPKVGKHPTPGIRTTRMYGHPPCDSSRASSLPMAGGNLDPAQTMDVPSRLIAMLVLLGSGVRRTFYRTERAHADFGTGTGAVVSLR